MDNSLLSNSYDYKPSLYDYDTGNFNNYNLIDLGLNFIFNDEDIKLKGNFLNEQNEDSYISYGKENTNFNMFNDAYSSKKESLVNEYEFVMKDTLLSNENFVDKYDKKRNDSIVEKIKKQIVCKGIKEYVPKSNSFINAPVSVFANSFFNHNQCVQIQHLLLTKPNEYKSFLPQIFSLFPSFCCDPHGNYLVQQIIPLLSREELIQMTNLVIVYFKEFYFHNYSTRVIQKLIELSNEDMQRLLAPVILSCLAYLCKDHNGIHIVIKTVTYFKSSLFVYDFIVSNIEEIAKDKEGCCLIQKILEKVTNVGYVRKN